MHRKYTYFCLLLNKKSFQWINNLKKYFSSLKLKLHLSYNEGRIKEISFFIKSQDAVSEKKERLFFSKENVCTELKYFIFL